jgi:putative tryptophan/tyrosine transport system substrate-binding protein
MKRREFIALLGGAAAAWPVAAWAQQAATPLVGFLGTASPDVYTFRLNAFREGLKRTGYVENENVNIEFRWAEGNIDQLPELARQLAHRQVSVIVAAGTASALAARATTTSIPIVFGIAADPIAIGLVSSLNRPGGNLTGVTSLNAEVGPKRLELLHELRPAATTMALLVNPASPALADPISRMLQGAAQSFGLRLLVLHASDTRDFDTVFSTLNQLHADALVIGADNYFTAHSKQLAALTVRHKLPGIYQFRQFAEAGGLMSYGSSESEYYRLIGFYAGRILKGEKPADLPVQQSTKIELVINLKTAKALDLTIPQSLLARADEVIE